MKKKTIIMFVYGDIITDARVQRAATALSASYNVTLISCDSGKTLPDFSFKNVLLKSRFKNGTLRLASIIFQAFRFIRLCKPDCLYAHDYYSTILLYFITMSSRRKPLLVYDSHEIIIPEKNIINKRLYRFYRFEKKIIKKVDLIVCTSEERGRLMVGHYSLKNNPIVIRNISQLSVIESAESKRINDELTNFFSQPGYTVVYAGVLGSSRCIDKLIEAVSANKQTCKLLIVGGGGVEQKLRTLAQQKDGLIYAFTGSVPYHCLGSILSRCDIGFVYYPIDTLNNIFCASNKVFEYASIGLPMISNNNPTIKNELEHYQIGVASDNLLDSIRIVTRNIEKYKRSCLEYTKNNPWQEEANKLVKTINTLLI